MAEIPPIEVTQKDLEDWWNLTIQLEKVKGNEMALRRKIFKYYFPTPKEGTNTILLPDNYQLKGVYTIDRKVDEAALVTLTPELEKLKIDLNDLIKKKPELAISEYRKLDKDQLHLVDQCLIIKPSASPALDIVPPSKKGT